MYIYAIFLASNEGWALGTGENRPIAEREAGTEIAV
jgi:hypothetical protein